MPPRRTLVVSVLMTSAWLALGLSADTSAQDRAIPQTVLIFIDDLHIRELTHRTQTSHRAIAGVSAFSCAGN